MATEKYTYAPGDDPQAACRWIRSKGGRAAIVGVTMVNSVQSQAIVFDSGFGTAAKPMVQGDVLSYDTLLKVLNVSLVISL